MRRQRGAYPLRNGIVKGMVNGMVMVNGMCGEVMRPACEEEVIGDVNDTMRCWEFQWLDTYKKDGGFTSGTHLTCMGY